MTDQKIIIDDLTGAELAADDVHGITFSIGPARYRLEGAADSIDGFRSMLERFAARAAPINAEAVAGIGRLRAAQAQRLREE
ncbi:MAG: hypothetical protein QM728_05750 [Gordonia sp. (in: high G+C Gram-positive bacteria)]|uniref:hypothetical protein n=1 Tax=Gordonia sp. (in: high G+C Gram-positive bacteria) TaxID=84139 RepID=UPI0039E3E8B6